MRTDQRLLERLEASAAAVAMDHIDVARRLDPGSPAAGERLGRGAMISTGPGRYVNRVVGATLHELQDHDLDAVERFYGERGLDPMVELSSWAPTATVARLRARGYGVEWFRSMFALDPRSGALPAGGSALQSSDVGSSGVEVEEVDDSTVTIWLDVLAAGNAIVEPGARAVSDEHALVNRHAAGTTNLVARVDGRTVGCGSVQVVDGVAWVGGAATLPDVRGRGVQSALLLHRLHLAVATGCDLVAATALPNGPSARNMDRLGLRLVQSQAVVARRTIRTV